MKTRIIHAVAGFMILLSLFLGLKVSENWFYLTGFVGFNLFQSAFTNWCPMMTFLRWMGAKDVGESIISGRV